MSTSSTSINDLADLSLAHIFSFLPPDELVRLERVSRKWQKVAKKYAWIEFRKLTVDKQELEQRGAWALTKYRALIDRCAPHLYELSLIALDGRAVYAELELPWTMLRNLRHLRFDALLGHDTLRAMADNLTRLQSIYFADIDRNCVAELNDLLRVNNESLHALCIPMCDYRGVSLRLSALPSSLRLLNITEGQHHDDELLELAASCCPQLCMLLLPVYTSTSQLSLTKLARLGKWVLLMFGNQIFRDSRTENEK